MTSKQTMAKLVDEVARPSFVPDPALKLEEHLQFPGKPECFGDLLFERQPICQQSHPFASHLAFGLVVHVLDEEPEPSNRRRAAKRRLRAIRTAALASGVEWGHNLARVVEEKQADLSETAYLLETLAAADEPTELELVPLTEQFVWRLVFAPRIKLELLSRHAFKWPNDRRKVATWRVLRGIELGMEYDPPSEGLIVDPNAKFGFSATSRADDFFLTTANALPADLPPAILN